MKTYNLVRGLAALVVSAVLASPVWASAVPVNDPQGNAIENSTNTVSNTISNTIGNIKGSFDELVERSEFLSSAREAYDSYQNFQGDVQDFMQTNEGLSLLLNGVLSTACGNTRFDMPKFSQFNRFPGLPRIDVPGICQALSQVSNVMGLPDYTQNFMGRLANYEFAENFTLNKYFADLDNKLDFGDGCLRNSLGIVVGARVEMGNGFGTVDSTNRSPASCRDILGTNKRLSVITFADNTLETLQAVVPEKTLTREEAERTKANFEVQYVDATVRALSEGASMRGKAYQSSVKAQALATAAQKVNKTGAIAQYQAQIMGELASIMSYRADIAALHLQMDAARNVRDTFKPEYDIILMQARLNAEPATPDQRQAWLEYQKKQILAKDGLSPEVKQKVVQLTSGAAETAE